MSIELSLRDVRAGYGPVEVLHGVSLDVPRGALTALLGPNGAGKSTLMSVVTGLVPVRSGAVVWAGHDVSTLPAYDRARAGMVLVPERRGIFAELSVRENLEVFAAGTAEQDSFDTALAAFPVLGQRLRQQAGSLSGGEQQMLAMSRALLRRPRLLLLDEISFGLAPRVVAQLYDVVQVLSRSDTTVVLVDQFLTEALRLADVVYVLSRGEVVFAGEPGELDPRALPGYVNTA